MKMYTLGEIFDWIWAVETGRIESKPIDQLTKEIENNG